MTRPFCVLESKRPLRSPLARIFSAVVFLALGACTTKSVPGEVSGSAVAPAPLPSPRAIRNGPWMSSSLAPEERSRLLIKEMTQDEKLTLLFGYYGTDAPWKGHSAPEMARPGSAGFVPGIARLGIPPQWQTDAGVGVATQGKAKKKRERTALPSGLAIAATWNPSLAEEGGAMIGAEARASGFNVLLAGGVNLLRDPYCGRNFEYGGEDPLLAGTLVGAQIQGIQSNHIISTLKHFAVNDQETDRDAGNSIIDDASARSSDLLAFQFAMERGNPGAVMCAYNRVNGDFSCESEYLLTEVLREDWAYKGFVLSDWGAVHSTSKAANAGLEQQSGYPFDKEAYFQAPLKKALKDGEVSEARLDEMLSRILGAMFTHGLFDHPVNAAPIDFEAHGRVSQTAAEEGAVLLKNEGNILPLSPGIKSVAVIGGYADKGVLSGGGSSQVYSRGGNAVPGLSPSSWPGPVVYYPSSPLVELEKLAPKTKFSFASGTDKKTAAKLAANSELALVFVTQWTTESIDTELVLSGEQDALIAEVLKANPRTIVVLETGGPVLMPWAEDASAIVQFWYPGTNGGKVIANVLTGQVNPSGHLPMTIAKNVEQLAHPHAPRAGDVHYREGAAVGYKWFDKKGHEPLFPFGHGLSYTSFAYEGLSVIATAQSLRATFRVKNTGKLAGKDVAQIYVSGRDWEAPKRLGSFEKIELKAGESKEVTLELDSRLLSSWHTKKRHWVRPGGEFEVLLGSSSREIHGRAKVTLRGATLAPDGRRLM